MTTHKSIVYNLTDMEKMNKIITNIVKKVVL